jgi:hypothetical protein
VCHRDGATSTASDRFGSLLYRESLLHLATAPSVSTVGRATYKLVYVINAWTALDVAFALVVPRMCSLTHREHRTARTPSPQRPASRPRSIFLKKIFLYS